jgi:hypothetical protein
MRPRRRLRMVLHREERKLSMTDTFDGTIIQVEVRYLERRCAGNSIFIANHCKAMVLGGDEHLPISEIPNRMIPTSVAIGQLGSASSKSQTDQLVPETDAEGWQPIGGELPNILDGIVHRSRITGPIRKKEAIRA